MGMTLLIFGSKLKMNMIADIYAFLTVTLCLNAITSIESLFDMSKETQNDADTVSDYLLIPSWLLVFLWHFFSVLVCLIGFIVGMNPISAVSNSELNEKVLPISVLHGNRNTK